MSVAAVSFLLLDWKKTRKNLQWFWPNILDKIYTYRTILTFLSPRKINFPFFPNLNHIHQPKWQMDSDCCMVFSCCALHFVSPPHCVRRIRLTKKCEHEKIGPQNSDQSSFLKWPHHNRLEFYHKIVSAFFAHFLTLYFVSPN